MMGAAPGMAPLNGAPEIYLFFILQRYIIAEEYDLFW